MTRESHIVKDLYADAHVLATLYDQAARALEAAQAGWPTSTPGAAPAEGGTVEGRCDEIITIYDGPITQITRVCNNPLPCPDHPTHSSSIVERTAGTDKHRRLLEQLHKEIRQAAAPLKRAAQIALSEGTPRLDATTVTRKLGTPTRQAAYDAGMWCRVCRDYGLRNPPEKDRTECALCADIRRDYNTRCPKEIHDLQTIKRLTDADIIRTLNRLGLKWKRPKQPKAS